MHDASYEVTVKHGLISSSVDVNNVTRGGYIDRDSPSYHIYYAVSTLMTQKLCPYGFTDSLLRTSSLMDIENHTWYWTDMSVTLPRLVENISISLLSPDVHIYIPPHNESLSNPVKPFETSCYSPSLRFVYDHTRLLAAYGFVLFVTAVCIMVGFRAVYLNGTDETFSLSRCIDVILNEWLFEKRRDLSLNTTRLKVDAGREGQLKPIINE